MRASKADFFSAAIRACPSTWPRGPCATSGVPWKLLERLAFAPSCGQYSLQVPGFPYLLSQLLPPFAAAPSEACHCAFALDLLEVHSHKLNFGGRTRRDININRLRSLNFRNICTVCFHLQGFLRARIWRMLVL